MKRLLIATSAIEFGTGAALLSFPSSAVWLLLGAPFDSPSASTVARVGGSGLITLGIACWFARGDAQSRAAKGLVDAMTFYNAATVAVLTYARIGLDLHSVALWPAVVLHMAMTVWCVVSRL
jgi:acetyl-CoA acetyltransferase